MYFVKKKIEQFITLLSFQNTLLIQYDQMWKYLFK